MSSSKLPEEKDSSNNCPADNTPAPIDPILISGKWTVSDLYAAISLAQPKNYKIKNALVWGFFFCGFIYLAWLTAHSYLKNDIHLAAQALGGAAVVLFVLCFLFLQKKRTRKIDEKLCREGKLAYAHTTGQIDETEIFFKSEDGEFHHNWSSFCRFRASKTVAVLYQHYPSPFLAVSRSKFHTEQDWDNFIQLAGRKLDEI